jgi:hypothetical protein
MWKSGLQPLEVRGCGWREGLGLRIEDIYGEAIDRERDLQTELVPLR